MARGLKYLPTIFADIRCIILPYLLKYFTPRVFTAKKNYKNILNVLCSIVDVTLNLDICITIEREKLRIGFFGFQCYTIAD